jgi:hypothetical protein
MRTDTEKIWRERVEEFRASGKTGRAFAEEHGFHETTLSKYLRQFPANTSPARVVALARVQPAALTPRPAAGVERGPIEIAVGRGCMVRVSRGFDEELLRAVLRVTTEGR